MVFADSQVIQVEWQALAVFGSTLGGALVAAAKIVAGQLARNAESLEAARDTHHKENREDSREAREENRKLSGAILENQAQTVQAMVGMQAEIRRVLDRLGECESDHGSKPHYPLPPNPKKPGR